MNKFYKISISALLFIFLFVSQSQSQYLTTRVKDKYKSYIDSLKKIEYNYVFPIFGQEAYSNGFDIPFPLGIMANGIWMDQGIDITNMQLGLKTDNLDIPLTPVDFIGFGENRNTSYSFNVRPDIWIFPFLNLYGLFGYGRSNTEVNLVEPIPLKSVVDQKISTTGFGVMTAFGVGPMWMSVDANWTWNKPELLDKAVRVNVLGLRLGYTFVFKDRPDRNIALWAGGMRAKMNSETRGAIQLIDALSPEAWEKRDQIVDDYYTWYNDLSAIQKKVVDASPLPNIVDRLEAADGSSIIRYGMDKQVSSLWNGIVGMQFQLNKTWMFRTEAGLLGDRKSFLFSINYRFMGFRK